MKYSFICEMSVGKLLKGYEWWEGTCLLPGIVLDQEVDPVGYSV